MLLSKCNCDCSKVKSGDSGWVVADRNSIKFDTAKGEIIQGEKQYVGEKVVDDTDDSGIDSTVVDYAEFSVTQEKTESKSFQTSGGVTITVGASFKSGVPFLAEGKVSTSLGASVSFASTAESTETT